MLLALMLVVHIAKVFHEHSGCIASQDKHRVRFDKIIYQHQGECKVCAFHLLGNGDLSVLTFFFLIPQVAYIFVIFQADTLCLGRWVNFYLRGPPISR
jgi:hypothetical protein